MWAISVVHTDDSLRWQSRLLASSTRQVCVAAAGLKYLCDHQRFAEVGEMMSGLPPGVVFLGGSSFHHLSYHLIRRCASQPLGVVVFDQHSDLMSAPPGYVSCGSWLRELVKLPTVRQVLIIGSDPAEAGADWEERLRDDAAVRDKVRWATPRLARRELSDFCSSVSRLYVTIDKDVLAGAATDWGQGSMSISSLLSLLRKICASAVLVGADVCGEAPLSLPWPSVAEFAQVRRNEDINVAISQMLATLTTTRTLRRVRELAQSKRGAVKARKGLPIAAVRSGQSGLAVDPAQ